MNGPVMDDPRAVAADCWALGGWLPLPGMGVLPINAHVIRAAEPVLVDTGLAALRTDFLDALGAVIDPADLRWIWLTHIDQDHVGNLAAVLEAAPKARVVTCFLGMGKLGLAGLPVDRCRLLNPGQALDVGDRRLLAVRPPCFDAPETMGLFDGRTRTLFSSDCFGALMQAPAESAAAVSPAALRDGLSTWATLDAPWLHMTSDAAFAREAAVLRALGVETVVGSHLPPAPHMLDTLLGDLASARALPPFVGPDQAALEAMAAAA